MSIDAIAIQKVGNVRHVGSIFRGLFCFQWVAIEAAWARLWAMDADPAIETVTGRSFVDWRWRVGGWLVMLKNGHRTASQTSWSDQPK